MHWNEDGRAYFETPKEVSCPRFLAHNFYNVCPSCDSKGYITVQEKTWIPEFDAPRPPEDWTPPTPDAIVAGAIKKRSTE